MSGGGPPAEARAVDVWVYVNGARRLKMFVDDEVVARAGAACAVVIGVAKKPTPRTTLTIPAIVRLPSPLTLDPLLLMGWRSLPANVRLGKCFYGVPGPCPSWAAMN